MMAPTAHSGLPAKPGDNAYLRHFGDQQTSNAITLGESLQTFTGKEVIRVIADVVRSAGDYIFNESRVFQPSQPDLSLLSPAVDQNAQVLGR